MTRTTLASILTPNVITLSADVTVSYAMEVMSLEKLSSLIIVDVENRPIGIFTERDSLKVISGKMPLDSRLSDVMTHGVYTVHMDDEVHDTYAIMSEKGFRHLVIVNDEGRLEGVATQGDFLRHIGFDNITYSKNIAAVMTKPVVMLSRDATITDAAAKMAEYQSDYAVITEGLIPIGIITERDILQYASSKNEFCDDPIWRVYQSEFPVCTEETSLSEAASLMENHGVHQLIIADEHGNLVGLLTRYDLLQALHGSYFEFLIRQVDTKNLALSELTDVYSKLVQDQDDLTKSEERFRILFDMLPDGLVLVDPVTHQTVDFNSVAAQQLGYTADEFSHLKISDYETIETKEETDARSKAILTSGRDEFETIHRRKDKSLMNVSVIVSTVTIQNKNYFLCYFRDITLQKENERKLLDDQEKLGNQSTFLHTLINTIPDLVWVKDINGVYLSCNEMFERLYDTKESDIIGKDDFYFVDSELAQFFQDHDRAAMMAGGSKSNEEFLKFADGSYEGWFDTTKTPMKDLEGNVIGVLGIARDITERKQREEEIKRKDADLNSAQELAHIGSWRFDISYDLLEWSDETYRIFGIEIGSPVSYELFLSCIYPDDRTIVDQAWQRAIVDRTIYEVDHRIIVNDEIKWVKEYAKLEIDTFGKFIRGIGSVQDITERKRKNEEIDNIQAMAHIGTWEWDIVRDEFSGSAEAYRVFGIEDKKIIPFSEIIQHYPQEDQEKIKYQLCEDPKENRMHNSIDRIYDNHGNLKWIDAHTEFYYDNENNPIKAVGIFQDITERKLYEEQLELLANYDTLTGLANRALLSSHLKSSIEKAKRHKTQIAVVMFDLDRFKDVNDSFGHAAGDELLQQVAQRFDERLRDGDIISRLGGDEFAIVLEHLNRPEDAGRIAKEMIEVQNASYKLISGAVVHIGMSAGIVIFPYHGESASELLQHADAALYKAKAEGRGIYRYYTDELTDSARQRIECETHLRRAVENNEFEVYYQPQVHIATGKIVGAEALVRWNDPERGMIFPSIFIPIAEDTGLISAIGEWVLNETCRQGKIWLDSGHRLTLAVNLSAHQVRHQNIPEMVEAALKKSGYPADKLELELTESALMQREEETVAMLHMLRAQGIRLAIDDFGTGYSSLSYLKRFPIDVLKIDKSFVDDLPFDSDDMAIVTAIIAMGTALGFQILAEGTERIEQIEFLKARGCTMYQGYYKSSPLPAHEFIKLLEQ